MCIYCGTSYYRLIYENHYGPIPKDEEGRSYEIHHKDGDNTNNIIDNLQCVSIREHYDIHLNQGDVKACLIMSNRMQISAEEKLRLARISNAGDRNPAFGTFWVTDGTSNMKLSGDDTIPEGWKRGRTLKQEHSSKFNRRDKSGKNNSRYIKTTYRFINTENEEQYILTPYEFRTTFKVDKKYVRELINGTRMRYKHWIVDKV